ncbi:MAG: hypothetical protein ACYC26_00895 [Phycisphaerales bacterium]
MSPRDEPNEGSRMRHGPDRAQRMIAETSVFLTWALTSEVSLPRIPRRSMDEGGFTGLLCLPGARAAVCRWWMLALKRIEQPWKLTSHSSGAETHGG